LIIPPDSPDDNEIEDLTFAHNWVESIDTVLQLMMSNAIWERYGFAADKEMVITRRIDKSEDGATILRFYLNDEKVLTFSKQFGGNGKLLDYTLYTHGKTNITNDKAGSAAGFQVKW